VVEWFPVHSLFYSVGFILDISVALGDTEQRVIMTLGKLEVRHSIHNLLQMNRCPGVDPEYTLSTVRFPNH
jgi:hypothetical protein